jgi:hypothetical protein
MRETEWFFAPLVWQKSAQDAVTQNPFGQGFVTSESTCKAIVTSTKNG